MKKIRTIYAPDYTGASIERFEFSQETVMYHWHGDTSYCGYTFDELDARLKSKV